MSRLMDLPDVKINTSRSGFDLSNRLLFSSKAGEMLPVFVQEVIPTNKKRITFEWFTRTQPLDTAAYTRLREYVDFYFVPYDQLWKQWRNFALQMNDNAIYASDINKQQSVSDKHPYFTVKQVADYIYRINNEESPANLNCFGFSRPLLSCKLLEYLGYGDFTPYLDVLYKEPSEDDPSSVENMVNVPLNPWPLLAYQKIYQDKIRNSQWEKSAPYTYNLDYIKGDNDLQIPVEDIDSSSRISMFDLQYMNWNKDYYMGLLPNSQYGDEAVVPIPASGSPALVSTDNYLVGPVSSSTTSGQASLYGRSQPPTSESSNYTFYGGVGFDQQRPPGGPDQLRLNIGVPSQQIANALDGISILLLRQYEMLQKYREVQQSAPTDYKSQIEKLFGVSLSWKDSNQVRWLGGVSRNIEINDIVNTNLESDGSRTTIHGKGVGVGDGSVTFDTDGEYGVVIGIYHVRPLLEYALDTPLKYNTKFRFTDYAQPAFDRIGLQAIPALELFNSRVCVSTLLHNHVNIEQFMSMIIGYGPRYLDYKTQIDRVVGIFKTSEKSWVAPFNDSFLLNHATSLGSFIPVPDVSLSPSDIFTYVTFKINPAILNPIFAVYVGDSVTGEVDDTVDTDQFISNIYFKVDDVKNLDYDGMPY